MANSEESKRTALKLRIGIVFIILFWLPAWLLAPSIAELLGDANNAAARHTILVVILLVQTAFGIIGLLLVSREILSLLKKVPRKKIPKTMWRILKTGSTDGLAES